MRTVTFTMLYAIVVSADPVCIGNLLRISELFDVPVEEARDVDAAFLEKGRRRLDDGDLGRCQGRRGRLGRGRLGRDSHDDG